MLVLSRRLNEKLRLPETNTVIQILGVKSGVVRLGIDAPPEITVLRAEVPDRGAEWRETNRVEENSKNANPRLDAFSVRWLKSTSQSLGLARLQLQVGQLHDALATLDRLHEEVQDFRVREEHKHGARDKSTSRQTAPPWEACKAMAGCVG